MKLKKTDLGKYLTGAVTSADIGFPKEKMEFWHKAQQRLGFHKENTLFVDDTRAVLKTAKKFGVKYLIYKALSNSKVEPALDAEFLTVMDFRALIE